jgi:hypothetical protein
MSTGGVAATFDGPEPAVGAEQAFPTVVNNFRIDLSAMLEPDCDSDGFSDESQDPSVLVGPAHSGLAP